MGSIVLTTIDGDTIVTLRLSMLQATALRPALARFALEQGEHSDGDPLQQICRALNLALPEGLLPQRPAGQSLQ